MKKDEKQHDHLLDRDAHTSPSLPQVVLLGAGFGGLQVARALRHVPVRVTVIEPGAVSTELGSHNRPEIQAQMAQRFGGITRLEADDISRAISYAVTQPSHVALNEVLIRPTGQLG